MKCSEAGTCSAISFADSCAGSRICEGVGFLEVRPAYQITVQFAMSERGFTTNGCVDGKNEPKDERRTIKPALAALRATHLVLSGFGGL